MREYCAKCSGKGKSQGVECNLCGGTGKIAKTAKKVIRITTEQEREETTLLCLMYMIVLFGVIVIATYAHWYDRLGRIVKMFR